MGSGNALAEAALETLPITVAVIDEDGEILLTNRSWRAFGSRDRTTDHVGVDYVATARTADDEHASRAVDGLEAVLAGERETFAMEYPCHSPDRKQWFLMRANRFTVDGAVRVSVVHLEITERKLAEIAAEETAAELREQHRTLEHVLERIDGLLREVTTAAVDATTREELERAVPTRLVETDPYVLAWVGRVDVTNRRLSPCEWAGAGDGPLEGGDPFEDVDLVLDSDTPHPAVEALETGEPTVMQDVGAVDDATWLWPVDADDRLQSAAALPVTYGDVTYGVLVAFADESDAFTERELLVLDSLAGTMATATNAIEARRMLTADTVVELEVGIGDASLFVASLAAKLAAPVSYRGLTDGEDGTPLAFFHVERGVDAVPPPDEIDGVTDLRILSTYDDGAFLEVEVDDDVVTALADHGAMIRRFDAAGVGADPNERVATGEAVVDLTVALPNGQSARSFYDLLEDRYEAVELISYHETDQPTRTPADVMERLESSLTDRQFTALRRAYYADYFEWPRNVSGEDLAQSMDISRSTFHQHLRTAQRKLLDELFDGDPTSEG